MKKQEAIELVNKGIGSIYSKEDVLNLISQIEDTQAEAPSFDGEAIVSRVMSEWDNSEHRIFGDLRDTLSYDDIIKKDDCTFTLEYGNTIELEEVQFDMSAIESVVKEHSDFVRKFVYKAIVDACEPKDEDTSIDEQVEQGKAEQYEQ